MGRSKTSDDLNTKSEIFQDAHELPGAQTPPDLTTPHKF